MESIFQIDHNYLREFLKVNGEPEFHANQIWQGIYNNLYSDWDEFSSLSKDLRIKLKGNFLLSSLIPIQTNKSADNKTQKYLFHLFDRRPIESVLMYSGKRITLCLSTQSGCSMGCTFCATGKMGLLRNLTSGEIIEQVVFFERILKKSSQTLTNIVFMGMGEPFQNYENLKNALLVLNNPEGLKLGSRRFTVSTIGLVPQILRFAQDFPQVNLAISLHAPSNSLRSSLVPMNQHFALENLISACQEYIKLTNRRISFEYVLIEGVNDSIKQADELTLLVKGLLCHINLIPLNPVEKSVECPSSAKKIRLFYQTLISSGIPTTIRKSQGIEIQAGCGQLAGKE
jgi:23S rRNA (adenine2503-C2)-methyltransferase